jgi:hypothetical protein
MIRRSESFDPPAPQDYARVPPRQPAACGHRHLSAEMSGWGEDEWELREPTRNLFMVETRRRVAEPTSFRLVAGTILSAILALIALALAVTFLGEWPGYFGGV